MVTLLPKQPLFHSHAVGWVRLIERAHANYANPIGGCNSHDCARIASNDAAKSMGQCDYPCATLGVG